MEGLLDWLAALPPAALYAILLLAATVENIFPPAPSDTVVAFGAFLAAQGTASLLGAFLATWAGSVGGAMLVFYAGRKFGAARLETLIADRTGEAHRRVAMLYGRYGLLGLALSRFIPGVRAVVPPVAGAMRLSPLRVAAALAIPSAIWYGAITVLAYRIGADWERLAASVKAGGTWTAVGAAAIALAAVVVWRIRRHARAG